MPQYSVRYFPIKALGESIRLLLAYSGEDFKDIRVDHEQWAKEKAETPFGQMPTLEVDGKVYAQSTAISRYLGKKFGLGGNTLEEDLEIDIIVDTFHDVRARFAQAHYEKDPAVQKRKYEDIKPIVTYHLNKLDQVIGQNNGFVALKRLTWGDFVAAGLYDYIKDMGRINDMDTKYPNIKKVNDHVYSIPKVKAWAGKVPK